MMNSQEVMRAFREETPVRFGDLVFSRFESIAYRRVKYNHYSEAAAIENVTPRHELGCQTLNIIQAECRDRRGNLYVLNPLRCEPAKPKEINVSGDGDFLFSKRMKLIDVFKAWCSDHGADQSLESMLAFLHSEGAIRADAACAIVSSFEQKQRS